MSWFHSILFEQPDSAIASSPIDEPAFFADLNLDQVRESILSGRQEYELRPFFHAPLREPASVRYRHEIVRDLESSTARSSVEAFANRMRAVRDLLVRAEKSHYALQQQRLRLEAIDTYCEAVLSLAEGLAGAKLQSRGFQALLEYLRQHVQSQEFSSLVAETRSLLEDLAEIRYTLHIRGNHVRVGRYEGEADFSVEVEETFAKFRRGAAKSYLAKLDEWPQLNHVEAQILALVARLHPDVFGSLAAYCNRHRDFLDRTIGRFDREVQFYLAYLEYIEPLKAAGLEFCYPEVSAQSKDVGGLRTFDLALASKLVGEGSAVVGNDFQLSDAERILVITGPNQGGKTTFARMVGQLHHLAGLGLPVPGAEARLFLPDRLFTHFEREEELATLRGKLEDELIRVHEILAEATGDSLIVMNESFTSTTLADALFLGTELIGRLRDLDALCVYVTFIDELSSLSEATVSMVATVEADDPSLRTFKVIRRPADGLAYAAAIAHKYGLGYESLRERVAR